MRCVTAVLVASLAICGGPAAAQDAAGKQPAAGRMRTMPVGDVYVHESGARQEVRGRLVEIGPSILRLIVDGQPRDIPVDRVLRIDTRGDSVKDGVIIGAVASFLWAALIWMQGPAAEAPAPAFLVSNTAFGALVGAGIDALHVGRTTIYKKTEERGLPAGGMRPAVAVRWRF